MRRAGWFAMAVLGAIPVAAAAQGVQGPLVEPDTPAASGPTLRPVRAPRHARKHAGKASAKSKAPPVEITRDTASPNEPPHTLPPTSHAEHVAPGAGDPISLGFKWQGNNDTAEKTRVQNYNGDAAGTGAAVGLNLHF